MPAKAPTWIILLVDLERPGDRPQHRLGRASPRLASRRPPGSQRDGEFVAAQPRDDRALAGLFEDRRRRSPRSKASPTS